MKDKVFFALLLVFGAAILTAASWPPDRQPLPDERMALVGLTPQKSIQDQFDCPNVEVFTNSFSVSRSTRFYLNNGVATAGRIIAKLPVATNSGPYYNVGEYHVFRVRGTNVMIVTNEFSQGIASTNHLTTGYVIPANGGCEMVCTGTNWQLISIAY